MPEGSVELDTQVMCWPAKTHIIVIIALHVVSGLAITGSAMGEFFISRSKFKSLVDGVTKGTPDEMRAAKVAMDFFDLYGGILLFFLLMPALWCLVQGAISSCLCCCKSKCCYGFYAIVSVLSLGFTAYSSITSFTSTTPAYMLTIKANDGGLFKMTFIIIGAMGILSALILAYCAFILCKLSYFDRSGGGQDEDLYDVDVESDSKSAETLKELTGVY